MKEYKLLKTSNVILQFVSFDWSIGNGILTHIPLNTNIVADTRQCKQYHVLFESFVINKGWARGETKYSVYLAQRGGKNHGT